MSEIRNYMEVCVDDLLDGMLAKLGGCTCENCRLDVKALALNSLPPKYVVTRKGQLYAKLNMLQQQFEVDAVAELTKAITLVNRNPRHEKQ